MNKPKRLKTRLKLMMQAIYADIQSLAEFDMNWMEVANFRY